MSLVTHSPPSLIPLSSEIVFRPTTISVIGMGYVGLVSMACLSSTGYNIIGVDTMEDRVDLILDGKCPIEEKGLGALLCNGVRSAKIDATTDIKRAITDSDVTFISVGTPTADDGGCDLGAVKSVARSIGEALAHKDSYHLVVMRCSIPPGTTVDVVIPEIEKASGKTLDQDFGVCFNPEFLREGVAIHDFSSPPLTVIGASDARAADKLKRIYWFVDSDIEITSIKTAEMLKYADNTWHALKVGFANEVGRFCDAYGVNSHDVMDLFVKDKTLNISPYYLKPGFAFGGSCLPKEVRAMQSLALDKHISLPIIENLIHSNDAQIADAERKIMAFYPRRIGFLGLTFKPDTDDVRESPYLELMANLRKRGIEVFACDPNLHKDTDFTLHADYQRTARYHLRSLIGDLPDILTETDALLLNDIDVLVVCHDTEEFRQTVERTPASVEIVDLAHIYPDSSVASNYHGLSW